MLKTANLAAMRIFGLKIFTIVILFVHLASPAQAVMASMGNITNSSAETSHCMHQTEQQDEQLQYDTKDCCDLEKDCHEINCSDCQVSAHAAVIMLVNLHRQAITPIFSGTSLIHVVESLQGIYAQNLFRPPIDLL